MTIPTEPLREALDLVGVIDASEQQHQAVAKVLDQHRPTPDRRTCLCGQFFRDDEEVRQRWQIHAAAAVLHALAALPAALPEPHGPHSHGPNVTEVAHCSQSECVAYRARKAAFAAAYDASRKEPEL